MKKKVFAAIAGVLCIIGCICLAVVGVRHAAFYKAADNVRGTENVSAQLLSKRLGIQISAEPTFEKQQALLTHIDDISVYPDVFKSGRLDFEAVERQNRTSPPKAIRIYTGSHQDEACEIHFALIKGLYSDDRTEVVCQVERKAAQGRCENELHLRLTQYMWSLDAQTRELFLFAPKANCWTRKDITNGEQMGVNAYPSRLSPLFSKKMFGKNDIVQLWGTCLPIETGASGEDTKKLCRLTLLVSSDESPVLTAEWFMHELL